MLPKPIVLERVKNCLECRSTKTGGKLCKPYIHNDENISFDPQYRQRLDHYGNSGEGWDEEGWYANYKEPLIEEVSRVLEENKLLSLVTVDVGEKGHLEIYPN
jgi:hypothetical protein